MKRKAGDPDGQGSSREYGSRAFRRGLAVAHLLLTHEVAEWKTLEEVARLAQTSRSQAYSALADLVAAGWAEKSEKGFRAHYPEIVKYSLAAHESLKEVAARLGLK